MPLQCMNEAQKKCRKISLHCWFCRKNVENNNPPLQHCCADFSSLLAPIAVARILLPTLYLKTCFLNFLAFSVLCFLLGECPCVATETYNTTITYVQMCVILLWEKIWACTNTLFLPLTCNRVVNLCIYKKEKNVWSTSLPVKGGWDPPNNRITSMLLNKKTQTPDTQYA